MTAEASSGLQAFSSFGINCTVGSFVDELSYVILCCCYVLIYGISVLLSPIIS
jgi:hypothetical protein